MESGKVEHYNATNLNFHLGGRQFTVAAPFLFISGECVGRCKFK